MPTYRFHGRRRGRVVSSLVALTVLLTALLQHGAAGFEPSPGGHAFPVGAATPAPAEDDAWIFDAIRPELRDMVQDRMPADLPEYRIAVTLEPQADAGSVPSLTGHLSLAYVNTTGAALDALPFRLYANGPDEEHDAQVVSDVTVDGKDVDVRLSVSDSVLEVPFATPLANGEAVAIEMDFATFLPIDSVAHYGIFGYDTETGTWALAHWYPVIAGRDPVTGWMLDHPSENGDAIFSDTALYDVTVESAADWRLATTGVAFGDPVETGNDQVARRFVSGPVRDFTIVADEDFEVVTREVDGITINSWYNPGQERAGQAVATYAAQSIAVFDDLLWPYPYREMDLMPVDMKGAAGCEFPQLIYMGLSYYEGNTDLAPPSDLDFTVAHEMVHQWFYGLVGNNQYADAFIDEGLTNYLSAQVYFERQYDDQVAAEVMDTYIRNPFEQIVETGGDQVVDQPTDAFPSGRAYTFAAYVKAPLGYEAIREEIGDEAFFAGLKAYVDAFVFQVATPDDLLAALEQSSGEDLQVLWEHWFEETDAEEDIP